RRSAAAGYASTSSTRTSPVQLVVGQIVRPHGIRGEVVVEVTTDEPAARFTPGAALVTDPATAGPLTIEAVRPHQGRLIVAFEGVPDRDGADALRGVKLCVDSAEVPPPTDPDEYHDFQLVGLTAVALSGEALGDVVRVDHPPGGGGPGMVMRPEPWGEALDALPAGRLVVPSPAGVPFTQRLAHSLAGEPHLIFACGRYEGIDQRVLDHAAGRMPVTEVSLGDYVLFGGEVAVLVIMEAVVRLLPGVLGNAESLVDESHADGLLEAPG